MTPIIFINCSAAPFIDDIISGKKKYETRTRDMLRRFVGQRVLLAETGSGRPVVRCSARIRYHSVITDRNYWTYFLRKDACIPAGSRYDWQPDTRKKHIYCLEDVQPVSAPFPAPEGVRHGRVWMEYND